MYIKIYCSYLRWFLTGNARFFWFLVLQKRSTLSFWLFFLFHVLQRKQNVHELCVAFLCFWLFFLFFVLHRKKNVELFFYIFRYYFLWCTERKMYNFVFLLEQSLNQWTLSTCLIDRRYCFSYWTGENKTIFICNVEFLFLEENIQAFTKTYSFLRL